MATAMPTIPADLAQRARALLDSPLGALAVVFGGAAALVAIVLALASGSDRVVTVAGTELRLRLDDFSITPQTVAVAAGRLKLVVYNAGTLSHNVRVEELSRDQAGNAIILGGTQTALPGQQQVAKLTLAPGRYRLADTLANHVDLGDFGTLIVR
jgi:hypothetical protein